MACTFLSADEAWAKWFYFDPLRLEAEIRFDGSSNQTEQTGNITGNNKNRSFLLEERLRLGISGYAYDPGIANISLDIIPVFRQGWERRNDEKDSGSGNDFDYNLNLKFLEKTVVPFSLGLNSLKATSSNDLVFGSRNNSEIEKHGITLNWKNTPFPMLLGFSTGSYKQVFTRPDGYINTRNEDRNILRLTGRSSKMKISLNSERTKDNIGDNDYGFDGATLNHNLLWGRNSHLNSDFRYFARKEARPFQTLYWSQSTEIQHTENLRSQASYEYDRQKATDITNRLEGNFLLSHHLYDNLLSSVNFRHRTLKTGSSTIRRNLTGAAVGYRKTFVFGSVSAGLNGSYESVDRESELGTNEVLDEKYQAYFLQPIILEQAFIDKNTITVSAGDGFPYAENVDYEIPVFNSFLTAIRILPSGRISENETLLISYFYNTIPSAKFKSITTGYFLSYGYRWLKVFYNSFKIDTKLVSGYGLPPDDQRRTLGLELSHDFEYAYARFIAESHFRRLGGWESRDVLFRQQVTVPVSNKLDINISASEFFIKSDGRVYPDPFNFNEPQLNKNSQNHYTIDAGFTWQARQNLSVSPSVGAWKRKEEFNVEELTRTEDRMYFTASIRVSWVLRKLTLELDYRHNTFNIDTISNNSQPHGSKSTVNQIYMSARRRFR